MARDKGDGTVFFSKSRKRWIAQVTLEGGKRPSASFRTNAAAHAWRREQLRAKERGDLIGTGKETVAEFGKRWLKEQIEPRRRWSTALSHKQRIDHAMPYIGSIRLDKLTPAHLSRCIEQMLDAGHSVSEVEASVLRIRQMLRYAVRRREIPWNPAEAIDPPKPERRKQRAMSRAQVQQLLDGTEDDRLHALWALLLVTGLRSGEAVGLRWADVDLGGCELAVVSTLSKRTGQPYEFGPPKTKSSRRTVSFGPELARVLREHRVRQVEERLAAPAWEGNDLVFPRPNGQPMHRNHTLIELKRTEERLGLPAYTQHELRHTAATLLAEDRDIPLKYVQEMLGHASIAITNDTYVHLSPTMHREAALRLDALLRKEA